MKIITFMALLALLILGISPDLSLAQEGGGSLSGNGTVAMMIGHDGTHCGSREISDYGTPTPMVIVGSGDVVPKGIYSPSNKDLIHGLYVVFQLSNPSDMNIKLGGRLDYIDEANRTDDIKVYVNDQFVDDWNLYDGKESTDDRGFIFHVPSRFTKAGMNRVLLSMEHLPDDINIFYSFSTITLSNNEGKATIGMDEPMLGSTFCSDYGTCMPTYAVGDSPSKFPERLLSPGYSSQVHGAQIKFNLSSPSDVLIKMNCWAWRDENNRNDDLKVYMNSAPVGLWDPYSGKQYYGNKTFLYEVPSEYTKAGMNNLTLSMGHLPDITLTWYAIYYMELDSQKPKDQKS